MQKLRYYFLVLLLCTTASQNADLFVHSAHIERKIKLTSIHKTKIKIPLSTTIVERKWQRYVTIDRVCFLSIRMDFIRSLMKPNLSNNIQLFGDEEKPFFSKHGFDHKWFFVEPNIHSCFL